MRIHDLGFSFGFGECKHVLFADDMSVGAGQRSHTD